MIDEPAPALKDVSEKSVGRAYRPSQRPGPTAEVPIESECPGKPRFFRQSLVRDQEYQERHHQSVANGMHDH